MPCPRWAPECGAYAVDAEAAVRRWIEGWSRGWAAHDPEPIAALYAEDAVFRSAPFREPAAPRDYVEWAFADEESVEFRFGDPIVAGDRAAVEYWAVIRAPGGEEETLAGIAVLRFGADGKVVDQHDYWQVEPGRREAWPGWGS